VQGFLDKHYFMLRRLNSLLGIFPVGVFFLAHMFLNSRAGQGPAQYQWVPDTLDQVPFLIVVEVFGILLPILAHAVLGVLIALRADYHLPRATRGWYGNFAFQAQRWTGIALFVLISLHVWQTWWHHQQIKLAAMHGGTATYDIYGSMHSLLSNPLWAVIYALFVFMAAWHFGNGIYNFAFKYGLTTSTASQRWTYAVGMGVALIGLILGLVAIWGLTLSDWAQQLAAAGHLLLGTR